MILSFTLLVMLIITPITNRYKPFTTSLMIPPSPWEARELCTCAPFSLGSPTNEARDQPGAADRHNLGTQLGRSNTKLK